MTSTYLRCTKIYEQLHVFQEQTQKRCFPNLPVFERMTCMHDVLYYLCPVLVQNHALDRLVACGVQGCVFILFRKNKKRLDRALKIVPFIAHDTHKQFEKEVFWMSKASRKHIAPKLCRLVDDQIAYVNKTEQYGLFVMETIDYTLMDVFKENTLNTSAIRTIMDGFFRCLMSLRKLRILHGDLRPDNIGIQHRKNNTYKVRLIDFGTVLEYSTLKHVLVNVFRRSAQLYRNASRFLFLQEFFEHEELFQVSHLDDMFVQYLKRHHPKLYKQRILLFFFKHARKYVHIRLSQQEEQYIDNTFPFPLNLCVYNKVQFVYRFNQALKDMSRY